LNTKDDYDDLRLTVWYSKEGYKFTVVEKNMNIMTQIIRVIP